MGGRINAAADWVARHAIPTPAMAGMPRMPRPGQTVFNPELVQLRVAFNNTARKNYVRHFATTARAKRMFSAEELKIMANDGSLPREYVVHHMKPLFRGGTNDFANLRVMRGSFHNKHFSKLHYYADGNNPYGR
jgi:hypothetical protein